MPPGPPVGPTAPPTIGPGTSLSYTGTLTQANTYAYPAGSPLPATSNAAQVTDAVNVSTSPPPPPLTAPGGASDYRAAETDAFPLQSVYTTTDSWQSNVASGALTQILQYGTRVVANGSSASASTIATQYAAPQILDEIPETNDAAWSNTNGGTVNETDADGSTDVTTRKADGTYTDTQQLANTVANLTIAVNADGSGTYGGTAFSDIYGFQDIAFSAPASGKITVEIQATPGPAPTAAPVVLATPAAWYTAGTPLYTDKTTVSTGVAFPGSCAVPAQFGTSGNTLTRKITSYDPVLGFTDAQTMVTYVVPSGPVCVTLNDLQTTYYDYLADTQSSYYNFADFEGTPQATQTIAQRLTLQNATAAASTFRPAATAAGASVSTSASAATAGGSVHAGTSSALSPASVAVATAQFEARVQHARTQRRKAAYKSFVRLLQHTVGERVR